MYMGKLPDIIFILAMSRKHMSTKLFTYCQCNMCFANFKYANFSIRSVLFHKCCTAFYGSQVICLTVV